MGLDLGRLLTNVGTLGTTWMRDQRRAKKEEANARDLVGQNTDMMQALYDRDFGESALSNLAADPLDVLAQRNAMSAAGTSAADLRGVGDRYNALSRTGYTDLDRQALEQGFGQARREEQSQRQAALSAAARRGDASGGNALLGSLMAQQGGANRAADQSTNVALEGRRRAMDALAQYGSNLGQQGAAQGNIFGMATGMRGQGVSEQAQRGGAIDAFNQWTAQQRSMDAQALANARLGQSQSMQQHAAQLQATPNLDAAANAVASYYTMGAAGNVAGSGGGNTVSTPGAKGAASGPSVANAPGQPQAYQPPAGGGGMNKSMGMTKGMANGPTLAQGRTQPSFGGGPMNAVQRFYGASGQRPRRNPITMR